MITTTKLHGFIAIAVDMVEFISELPEHKVEELNPYTEAVSLLRTVRKDLEFIIEDVKTNDAGSEVGAESVEPSE
jgi:hypothetical protein